MVCGFSVGSFPFAKSKGGGTELQIQINHVANRAGKADFYMAIMTVSTFRRIARSLEKSISPPPN